MDVQAYKYVPFGPVGETMPYLIRRAQENGDVLHNVLREKRLMRAEIWRRLRESSPLSSVFGMFSRRASSEPAVHQH